MTRYESVWLCLFLWKSEFTENTAFPFFTVRSPSRLGCVRVLNDVERKAADIGFYSTSLDAGWHVGTHIISKCCMKCCIRSLTSRSISARAMDPYFYTLSTSYPHIRCLRPPCLLTKSLPLLVQIPIFVGDIVCRFVGKAPFAGQYLTESNITSSNFLAKIGPSRH
jgi:hypothetical protein